MMKLITRSAFLAGLILVTLMGIFWLPVPSGENLAAIMNKRDLLKTLPADRIVFVGGSGLFDGISSEEVEARLHRPVVNMGLYAGFGITAILREIQPRLQPGDIVVIIPEYGVVFDEHDFQAQKWIFALSPFDNFSLLYSSIPKREVVFLADVIGLVRSKLEALPKAVQEATRSRRFGAFLGSGYVYYPRYFNRYGDSLRTMRAAIPGQIEQKGAEFFVDGKYEGQSLAQVNAFCSAAAARGVRTFFLFPAYPRAEYLRQQEGMRRYEARLRKELQCRILGTPQDFLYPYEFFTNTVNHINSEARSMRTRKVADYLEMALQSDAGLR